MDPRNRRQLAERINEMLLQRIGSGIDVQQMLAHRDYAREVLYVCDGTEDGELKALAKAYAAQTTPPPGHLLPELTVAVNAPQDAAWARNTSGFGIHDVPDAVVDEAPAVTRRRGVRWFNPSRWLRRETSPR